MMIPKFLQTLQGKVSFFSGLCLFITSVCLVGYTSVVQMKDSVSSAKSFVQESANAQAYKVRQRLEKSMLTARTLAQAFQAQQGADRPFTRESANQVMSETLRANSDYLGIWTCWEPDAFDGQDSSYANTDLHDKTGRFIPYCYWNGNSIDICALESYDVSGDGDYYQLAKRSGKEVVVGPYFYEVDGKNILMTTFSVPIKTDTVKGVAGVDIRVDFIQSIADNFNAYDNQAAIAIISESGSFTGFKSQPEMVGKDISEWIKDGKSCLQTAKSDNVWQGELDDKLVVITPFSIGQSGQDWYVAIAVPMGLITADARSAMINSIALGAIFTVAGLIILWLVAKSIATPIRITLEGLLNGATQTKSAADEVSRTSQVLAQGNSEQAASIEEMSANIEQTSSIARRNAEGSGEANELTRQAQQQAEDGNELMAKLNGAMEDIKQSSDETATIIKSIDEIAFQTNLLALNAAVEAARAGEAGKGFAVVAEEVRNLARRSADASRNTTEMVGQAIERSNNGMEISGQVLDVFASIVEKIHKISSLVNEISQASQTQADSIGQLNSGIDQVEQVTQANAASSEESASAAEELNSQSVEMANMVETLSRIIGTKGSSAGFGGSSYTRGDASMNIDLGEPSNRNEPLSIS